MNPVRGSAPPEASDHLPSARFALLFAVMLIAASGNTAMQSLLPSIGRELAIPDLWVGLAFSLSALAWVIAAPFWARMADRRGRRALMRRGLYGYIVSTAICGLVLALALGGHMAPALAFLLFTIGRAVYGIWGSASPPAVQAYIAARTEGAARTRALAALASSFGLGTIIGPALAPLFIFPPFGLSGPLVVFAAVGVAVLIWLALGLPDDTPTSSAKGPIVAYPGIGSATAGVDRDEGGEAMLGWRDTRVASWLAAGAVGGHGQAIALGMIGFLVIDRLGLPATEAQHWIAIVLIVGAAATLLAQWWLIPVLSLGPRQLVIWGSVVAAAGSAMAAVASEIYGIAIGYALLSAGFGLFRPGFTSGASLAVEEPEQNRVAGMVTSVNGIAYVAAPAIGVLLYGFWRPLPLLLAAVLMIGLAAWAALSPRLSSPEA